MPMQATTRKTRSHAIAVACGPPMPVMSIAAPTTIGKAATATRLNISSSL
ncbi:MAG TPA: hypothetical protein VGW80_09770 [Solirubrobacterales bacterium]|nr:hypothetical protein [Solirubrobacterales bacterium]